ncbi:hypothetical protein [Saliphagus infecundisoli]|uniref:Oligosaccharide repeat unit polymerase n=1 Tax=Saliphagus infecundisoli TaxID=1849069 RepID=A0ABD5QJD6_9EURY|nr:hypothetical protein [Saliphagus infecundisoli]
MDVFAILLVVLLAGLVAVPWAIAIRDREIDYFEPIIFHSIFVGMLGLVLADDLLLKPDQTYRWDVIPWSWHMGTMIAGTALTVTFASTLVGYYVVGPRVMAWVSERVLGVRAAINNLGHVPGELFRAIGIVYMLVGLVAFGLIVLVVFPTNNPLFVYTGITPRSQLFAGAGPLRIWTRAIPLGYLLYLCGVLTDQRTPSVVELGGLVPVVIVPVLLGSRGGALTSIVLVTIVLYYATLRPRVDVRSGRIIDLVERLPPMVRALIIPAMGVLLAPTVVALRWLRDDESLPVVLQRIDLIPVLTAGVHDDQFENFLALLSIMPEEIGFYYGTFYFRAVTNFVPSAIWPGKPISTTGGVLYRTLGGETGGRPPGAIGDYFINFGPPGLLLMGLLFGVFLYFLYQLLQPRGYARRRRPTPFVVVLFAVILTALGSLGLTANALYGLLADLIILVPAFVLVTAVRTGFVPRVSARVRSRKH